jgi:hypothetical protein
VDKDNGDLPICMFAFAVEFYRDFLHVRHETGTKLLACKVIRPDAVTLASRPLFRTDVQSVERQLAAIKAYRVRQKAAGANILDLTYVA